MTPENVVPNAGCDHPRCANPQFFLAPDGLSASRPVLVPGQRDTTSGATVTLTPHGKTIKWVATAPWFSGIPCVVEYEVTAGSLFGVSPSTNHLDPDGSSSDGSLGVIVLVFFVVCFFGAAMCAAMCYMQSKQESSSNEPQLQEQLLVADSDASTHSILQQSSGAWLVFSDGLLVLAGDGAAAGGADSVCGTVPKQIEGSRRDGYGLLATQP